MPEHLYCPECHRCIKCSGHGEHCSRPPDSECIETPMDDQVVIEALIKMMEMKEAKISVPTHTFQIGIYEVVMTDLLIIVLIGGVPVLTMPADGSQASKFVITILEEYIKLRNQDPALSRN